MESVERWALFVKNNPLEKWKPIVNEFTDSQYNMHVRFLEKLKKTKEFKRKIINLYQIKNIKGYAGLLKN